mgnify:FL=1
MADKIVVIKLDVQQAGAEAQIVSLNSKLDKLTKGSEDYELILKKIAIQEDRLVKIQAKRAVASNGITKQLTKQKDATGSTTAATMELSRIVSDAPYGIRGMANNITQLVSQLGTASKASGGLGGAIKGMIKQLTGPLGAVFAITLVVSALDFMYGANKKAEGSTNDYADSLKGLEKTLSKLYTTQNNLNKKFDEYASLAKLRRETDALMKKEAIKLDEVNKKIADQEEFNAIAKARRFTGEKEREKILSDLLDKRNIIYKVTTDAQTKLNKKTEEFNSAKKGTVKALEKEKSKLIEQQKTLSSTSVKWEEYAKKIKDKQAEIDAITGGKDEKGGKVKKISPFKTPEELELDVKNNLSAIDKLQRSTEIQVLKKYEKEELALAKTQEEKKIIKEHYASENLEVQIKYELKALDLKAKIEKTAATEKQNAYVKGLDAKLVAYEKSLRNEKGVLNRASKDALAIATTETEELKKASKKELAVTVFGIQEEYAKLFPFWVQLAEARRDALGIGTDEGEEDSIKKWFDKYAFYAEQAKALISGVADFVDSEFERELVIEQNKTNALNNELNKRLLNENLSKDQKKAIQLQISQNDEKLRIRQEQIARKRFKVMKAFNLATALTDTYLATQKAYVSQLQLDPTSPIRAKIAAGIALASGLANVAAIARTKFESSAGSSPALAGGGSGGGGGGDSRTEPSFNIVGRSNDNILLSAIQSQFDQPLRAYVVARDVTNQQQLDGVISTAAST